MNVYRVTPDLQNFAVLVWKGGSPHAVRPIEFARESQACHDWKPPIYEARPPEDEGYPGPLPEGDFVGLGAIQIGLRERARAALGDVFKRDGELLPVQVGDNKEAVWVFHCLTVIDAMDVANSNTYGVNEFGRPRIINRISFYPERVKNAMLFRLPWIGNQFFCTDTFRQLVADRGLQDRGLEFVLQWSDEPENMAKIRAYDERTKMPRKGA